MAGEFVARRVVNHDLTLDDRDEGIARVADAIQHVSNIRGALLAEPGDRLQLRR